MALAIAALPRRELKSIGLVSVGHAFSHFYMVALVPLFPLLQQELGISWAALGMLVAAHAIGTGALQVPAGMLVDRIGARPVLLWGLGLNAAAFTLVGLTASFPLMLVLMAVAGLGNSVFHPADYAILSAKVDDSRVGRAFSVHLFAGYVGWVLTPPVMLLLAALWDWRTAVIVVGLAGLLFVAYAAGQKDAIDDTQDTGGHVPNPATKVRARPASMASSLSVILSPAVLMFFLFYFCFASASIGLQTFSVVAIMELYGVGLETANAALTANYVAGGIGVLVGGYFADKVRRHEILIGASFVLAAGFVAIIGLPLFSVMLVPVFMFLGALCATFPSPSRDVLVRNSSPPGAIGVVFGFVSTGFSAGGAVAPPLFGWVNDLGHPEYVFWLFASITLVGILTMLGAKNVARA